MKYLVLVALWTGLSISGVSAQESNLNFRQKGSLKSGLRYLDRYEGDLLRYEKELKKIAVSHKVADTKRAANRALRMLQQMSVRFQRVLDEVRRGKCPSDHPKVKPLHDRIAAARKRVETLLRDFTLVRDRAVKAWDPGSYPELKKDRAKLIEITRLCVIRFRTNAEWNQYVSIRNNLPKWSQWLEGREKAYAKFLSGRRKVKEAAALDREIKKAKLQIKSQVSRTQKILGNFVKAFKQNLGFVQRLMKARRARDLASGGRGLQALAKAKLLLSALEEILGAEQKDVRGLRLRYEKTRDAASAFSAAARDHARDVAHKEIVDKLNSYESQVKKIMGTKKLRWAQQLQKLAYALKHSSLSRFAKLVGASDARLVDVLKRTNAVIQTLNLEIPRIEARWIDENRAPKDVYAGADKEDLRIRVRQAWRKRYPREKILEIRFSTSKWKRVTEWKARRDGNQVRIEKFDRSHLRVTVIVMVDGRTCTMRVATFSRNHMANDLLRTDVVFRGADTAYTRMLRTNL